MAKRIQFRGRLGNNLFQLAYGLSENAAGRGPIAFTSRSIRQLETVDRICQAFGLDVDLKYALIESSLFRKFSEKQFDVQLIRQMFRFKCELPAFFKDYDFDNTVSMHVRRGDYVTLNDIFRVMGTDYYAYAYDLFFNDWKIAIATDDIAWCKQNMPFQNVVYIDEITKNDQLMTLYVMSLCRGHIGGCSTFSWWGSWLNETHNSINVYPHKWFNDSVRPFADHEQYIQQNIVPDRWLRLDY